MSSSYSVQKILNIFGADINRNTLIKAELQGQIPVPQRQETGAIKRRAWTIMDLPKIGERYGFLKKPESPLCLTFFTTKGGVLKTTLALNFCRLCALHNMKVVVVGLDLQGDISGTLGFNNDLEEAENMEAAISRLSSTRGLYDLKQAEIDLLDLIQPTDIPTLFYIPETPELVQLEQAISLSNRREYWLKEQVVDKLKAHFDLVIIDCSPNWNRLVTNALVASDVLISPLECKINNFRNFTVFRSFLNDFKSELKLNFESIFIPTRFTSTRKLSSEIKNWYLANVQGCMHASVRESAQGEDATALKLSLPEFAPTSLVADEMREILLEAWARILPLGKKHSVHAHPAPLHPSIAFKSVDTNLQKEAR